MGHWPSTYLVEFSPASLFGRSRFKVIWMLQSSQCYRPMNMILYLQNLHQPETWRRLVNVGEATGDVSTISAAYDALLKQYPNTVTYCGGLVSFIPLSALSWLVLRLQLKFNISTTFWTLSPRFMRPNIYSKNSWELRRVWNFGHFIWLMWGTLEFFLF